MSEIIFNYYPQFFTATILEWKHLLVDDKMKGIIISRLQFLVNEGRVNIYGFVLMPNHIHIIWQIQDGYEKAKVQQSFLKYTAQQMKFTLVNSNAKELEKYKLKYYGLEIHRLSDWLKPLELAVNSIQKIKLKVH